jgi:flagellar biosynthetic protein FlhB
MSGADTSQDRTFAATPRKLEQARQRGDVPASREGGAAGLMIAALLGVLLAAGPAARQVTETLLPMIEQPEAFLDLTEEGWQMAAAAAVRALAIGILPVLGLAMAGALLPHLLQNSVVFSAARIAPKLSNLSPGRGIKRILGPRALFEFAKALVKTAATGVACYAVLHGMYAESLTLVAVDMAAAPQLLTEALASVLLAATLVGVVIAGIDVPYQQWTWRRRQRMTLQEIRDEMRSTEGDPQVKMRQRRVARQRAQRRMMHDVPKASVVVMNPTHYAVALRYRRGEDAAPVVVAKGRDLVALRIRDVARQSNVPVVEDAPLARALHAGAEIGEVIPAAQFEAVAKIIGLVWARNGTFKRGAAA